MRTANPMFRGNAFAVVGVRDEADDRARLTVAGTMRKAVVLAVLLLAAAWYVWRHALYLPLSAEGLAAVGGGIAMVFGVVTYLRREWAGITSPVFAMCIGMLVGGMSSYLARTIGAPVGIAVMGSPAAFVVMLWLYNRRVLHPSDPLRMSLNIVTGGMFLLYLLTFVMQPLGVDIPVLVLEPVAITLCALTVSVAALNLTLDVEEIERAARESASAEFEWFGAFALLVTLVWMYPESIRLLARVHARVLRGGPLDDD